MNVKRHLLVALSVCSLCFAVAPTVEAIYVTNYTDNTLYRVDPTTGMATLVTPTPLGSNVGAIKIKVVDEIKRM